MKEILTCEKRDEGMAGQLGEEEMEYLVNFAKWSLKKSKFATWILAFWECRFISEETQGNGYLSCLEPWVFIQEREEEKNTPKWGKVWFKWKLPDLPRNSITGVCSSFF